MTNNRSYTKEEISDILSRASKIQTRKELYSEQQGLTEDDLIHIAEEVGIDKDSVIEAIQHPNVSELDSSFNWITGSSKIQDFKVVDGEITQESWEKIVQDIRRVTGGIGKLNTVGKSFEWEQRLKEVGYKHISLTPENGSTKIQLVSNWRGLTLISTFLSFLAGAAITGIFLDGTNFADYIYLLLPSLIGLGGIGLSRFYLKHYFEKQKRMFREIIQSVGKRVNPSSNPGITLEENRTQEESDQSTHFQRERS